MERLGAIQNAQDRLGQVDGDVVQLGPEHQRAGDGGGGRAHVQDDGVAGGDHPGGVHADAGLLQRRLPLRRFEGPLPQQSRRRHRPPRTLRTRALASSAVRSARTVTADTPKRPARSVTRANRS